MVYTFFDKNLQSLRDKKGITIVNAFQRISDDSKQLNSQRKPSKIWIDKGSEF